MDLDDYPGDTVGGVRYTDAQRLTIALAELASALGKRLDPLRKDWWNVEAITAHLRRTASEAEQLAEPMVGEPRPAIGTQEGDMRLIRAALMRVRISAEVSAAFDRTLERLRKPLMVVREPGDDFALYSRLLARVEALETRPGTESEPCSCVKPFSRAPGPHHALSCARYTPE